jgi:hypothetical protein
MIAIFESRLLAGILRLFQPETRVNNWFMSLVWRTQECAAPQQKRFTKTKRRRYSPAFLFFAKPLLAIYGRITHHTTTQSQI